MKTVLPLCRRPVTARRTVRLSVRLTRSSTFRVRLPTPGSVLGATQSSKPAIVTRSAIVTRPCRREARSSPKARLRGCYENAEAIVRIIDVQCPDLPCEMRCHRQSTRLEQANPCRRAPAIARKQQRNTIKTPKPDERRARRVFSRSTSRRSAHRPPCPDGHRWCRNPASRRSRRHTKTPQANRSAPVAAVQPTSAPHLNVIPKNSCGHQVIRFIQG